MAEYVFIIFTFIDYFTADCWDQNYLAYTILFRFIKTFDKEETRWRCGQFTVSFKIFKGFNLVLQALKFLNVFQALQVL